MDSPFLILLYSVLIGALIFFAVRSLMLWYWKVDEIIKELKEQNTYLKKLVESKVGENSN